MAPSQECDRVEVSTPSVVAPKAAPASVPRRRTLYLLVAAAFAAALVIAAVVTGQSTGEEEPTVPIAANSAPARSLKGGKWSGKWSNITSLDNPFHGKAYYKNPTNQKSYDASIETASGMSKRNLIQMREVPSAYWIDVKSKIHGTNIKSLEGILEDASSKPVPEMVVFIWYDLPNRDCHAKASNGEICCKYLPDGKCDYEYQDNCYYGLLEYQETYCDPFVDVLEKYQYKVPIAIVMEPDSLPNLATNTDDPRCGGKATAEAYQKGIKYALEQLTTKTPEVAVYLDAAHGGWLGWQDNLRDYLNMLADMNLPFEKMRGFATNVANYQPLGVKCPHEPDSKTRNGYCLNNRHSDAICCYDPCGLAKDWSAGNNELNYAQDLAMAARDVLGMQAHVVIDTGRNGVVDMRDDCADWCNVRGAGAGIASTANTGYPEVVDAYFWLKTPGESDGCTRELPDGKLCPRFDKDCGSEDSLGSAAGEPRAPEAGKWFDYQVKQLALFAHLEDR